MSYRSFAEDSGHRRIAAIVDRVAVATPTPAFSAREADYLASR